MTKILQNGKCTNNFKNPFIATSKKYGTKDKNNKIFK